MGCCSGHHCGRDPRQRHRHRADPHRPLQVSSLWLGPGFPRWGRCWVGSWGLLTAQWRAAQAALLALPIDPPRSARPQTRPPLTAGPPHPPAPCRRRMRQEERARLQRRRRNQEESQGSEDLSAAAELALEGKIGEKGGACRSQEALRQCPAPCSDHLTSLIAGDGPSIALSWPFLCTDPPCPLSAPSPRPLCCSASPDRGGGGAEPGVPHLPGAADRERRHMGGLSLQPRPWRVPHLPGLHAQVS